MARQPPVRSPYRLPPRRPRPRRSLGGAVAGILGVVAAILVFAVLGLATFMENGGVTVGLGGRAPEVKRETATHNPLYRTGRLTPVGCRLPGIEAGVDSSMERFMETLSRCLDRSWGRQFDKAELAFDAPKRIFWNTPGRGPCGSFPNPGAAAFYCPENNTMYVGLRHIVETSGGEPVSHYAVYARVIAHEYGHHVQERAGILAYGHRRMDTASVAARTEASRRIELQAQCLAGLFLGAERSTLPMTRRQYEAMMVDVRGRGDEKQPAHRRDHGSGHHYAGWVEKGYRDPSVGVCDTWSVPAADVD
ncbi:neutral zinc metallopeptidase [Thermomonospora umbrina]|nr:neutral zinc metallopeptidase [Thermomonospora umbrina]